MTGRNIVPFNAPFVDAPPPPHNEEAERSLLGALLLHNDGIAVVAAMLKPEHFYFADHQEIYGTLIALLAQGLPATPITVKGFLPYPEIGGVPAMAFLASICAEATSTNPVGYAEIVRTYAARRELLKIGTEVAQRARSAGAEASALDLIEEAETSLLDVRAQAPDTHLSGMSAADSGSWMLDRIRGLREGTTAPTAVPTGIQQLDEVTGGFVAGQLWMIAGRPGMGKAQPLASQVRTQNGWKAIGDLRHGDALVSVDGSLSEVVGVHERGALPVYRFRLSDGRETRCCGDHLWEVMFRGWNAPRVKTTNEIIQMLERVRYRGRLSIRMHSGHGGHSGVLPVEPYLLGVILGDGGISQDAVNITTPDAQILDAVRALLPAATQLVHADKITYRITRTQGRLNPLIEALRDLGLMGKLSSEKFIPRRFLDADRQARLDLLRGLMDTDGWVEANGCVQFASSSPQLALDVQELARSLGCWVKRSVRQAFVYAKNGTKARKLDSHKLTMSGEGIQEVFTLERKSARVANRRWFRALTIESITEDGVEPCRCISVSHPSRLYVTDDHIVTHNTVAMTSLSRFAAREDGSLVLQLEVTRDQQMARYFSDLAYTASHPLGFGRIMRAQNLDDEDMWLIEQANERFAKLNLRLEVQSGMTMAQIVFAVRAEKKRLAKVGKRLGTVFIDYLKFIKVSDRYKGQRVLEIGEISGALKMMAKEEDLCVILLVQLNRALEKQDDKRPSLADLRDSGELEQDADVVLFLYRDAYYLEKDPKTKHDQAAFTRLVDCRQKLEMILGKNRSGLTSTLDLWCDVAHSAIRSRGQGL